MLFPEEKIDLVACTSDSLFRRSKTNRYVITNQPPRSTQPGHPSVSRYNECQRMLGRKRTRHVTQWPHIRGLSVSATEVYGNEDQRMPSGLGPLQRRTTSLLQFAVEHQQLLRLNACGCRLGADPSRRRWGRSPPRRSSAIMIFPLTNVF